MFEISRQPVLEASEADTDTGIVIVGVHLLQPHHPRASSFCDFSTSVGSRYLHYKLTVQKSFPQPPRVITAKVIIKCSLRRVIHSYPIGARMLRYFGLATWKFDHCHDNFLDNFTRSEFVRFRCSKLPLLTQLLLTWPTIRNVFLPGRPAARSGTLYILNS